MTSFDFAPLFRTAIGFDRLAQLMDAAASTAEMPSYPPYNIEKTGEDTYRLTMAVAGFRPENLEMVVEDHNGFIAALITDVAPVTSRTRTRSLPARLMPPIRCFPAVECSCGVRPAQAAR
jgi:HSP20 family molecular chaperone IbpA